MLASTLRERGRRLPRRTDSVPSRRQLRHARSVKPRMPRSLSIPQPGPRTRRCLRRASVQPRMGIVATKILGDGRLLERFSDFGVSRPMPSVASSTVLMTPVRTRTQKGHFEDRSAPTPMPTSGAVNPIESDRPAAVAWLPNLANDRCVRAICLGRLAHGRLELRDIRREFHAQRADRRRHDLSLSSVTQARECRHLSLHHLLLLLRRAGSSRTRRWSVLDLSQHRRQRRQPLRPLKCRRVPRQTHRLPIRAPLPPLQRRQPRARSRAVSCARTGRGRGRPRPPRRRTPPSCRRGPPARRRPRRVSPRHLHHRQP